LKAECISHGGLTEVSVDVRVIMREAVLNNTCIMAIAHNHPSGNIRPSKVDDMLTQSVKKACELLRIHLTDHVIVTDGFYYSYAEEGRL
jgi:DNA repair protein RadC